MAEGSKKTRKKANVRTDADLIAMGTKGKVFLVVRKAFALAENKNGFGGTVRAGKKYPSGVLYSKGKEGGSYWNLSDAEFAPIKKAASKALSSVKKLEVDGDVKSLIDAFSNAGGSGRGGSALNMSSLEGLSL